MEEALSLIIKYAPDLVEAVKSAFVKAGYTVDQVETIFAAVRPYEELGIDPAHPNKPE